MSKHHEDAIWPAFCSSHVRAHLLNPDDETIGNRFVRGLRRGTLPGAADDMQHK